MVILAQPDLLLFSLQLHCFFKLIDNILEMQSETQS
jgi:hypothetical protein